MRGKVYKYEVFPLGKTPIMIRTNVGRYCERGWTLMSTYWDPEGHQALMPEFRDGPILMGIFSTWTKEKRR